MNRLLILAIMTVFVVTFQALSQTQDPPRYEIAAEFTTLNREASNGARVEPGLGARFTFNFNKNVAIEGAMHISFNDCPTCTITGRYGDLFAGVKAGKRFKSWGIFAKARPGDVNLGAQKIEIVQTGTSGPFPFEIRGRGVDNFAFDVGGVVEFYPSRRIVTRFDAGDTIIHLSSTTSDGLRFDPATGSYTIVPVLTPARTTNNFQFMASVGFRF
ncbi:MAG TPA: hypothetical protein VJ372_19685 [Pyrinomonadaceae bacterium]|nr:hypothetical protein [Pyrinomonadaceae bacterium]